MPFKRKIGIIPYSYSHCQECDQKLRIGLWGNLTNNLAIFILIPQIVFFSINYYYVIWAMIIGGIASLYILHKYLPLRKA